MTDQGQSGPVTAPNVPSFGRRSAPGESEFSHGPGLTRRGREDAPPNRGGRYHGLAPAMEVPGRLAEIAGLIAERERSAGEHGGA